jgi:hypothetical protein
MLYVDDNSIIHADEKGVHSYNTQRLLFDDKSHCIIYRLKNEISEENIDKVITYMRRLIGRPYSTFEAMLTKFYKGDFKSKKLFCSRLVAQAYLEINTDLALNPDYCSPEDILNSSHLKQVTIPLRKLTEIEKRIVLTTNDKPTIQAETTNKLFTNIIKFTSNKNIYDFEILSNFLVNNPQYDNDILNIINESGYFIMWIDELKDNAALYDNELYSKVISNEQKLTFSKSSLDTLSRYQNNYNDFQKLYLTYKLDTFINFIVLYAILSHNESLRLTVMNIIEMEEENVFILFLQILIKIFFVKKGLQNIIEEKTYESKYYNLIQITIKFIIDNLGLIKDDILKYKFESNFNLITESLEKISDLLNNIIYIETRQKRDPKKLYNDLKEETNKLIKIIDSIEYINIIKYS